jgi:hypothetical protein
MFVGRSIMDSYKIHWNGVKWGTFYDRELAIKKFNQIKERIERDQERKMSHMLRLTKIVTEEFTVDEYNVR